MASLLPILAVAVLGTVAAFLRVPDVSARTIWAEDGALFLHEYFDQGPGLLHPYAGYLHLLPRIVVAVVTPLFGLDAYALAITVACSMILGLVAALTFYCASALTSNLAARLCWASIPVLVAPGALETMANVANLHWYLLWLAPWVLVKSPTTVGQKILLGVSALVIGLTEIQTAIFLPLVLFRWRNKSLWWAKAGLAAGVACQLFTMWMYPRFDNNTGAKADLLSVFYGYFLNSSSALVYGSSAAIRDNVQNFGALPIVASALPFVAVALLVAILGNRLQRLAGATFLLASGAVWGGAVILNPAPWFNYAHFEPAAWGGFFLSRYSTVPSMFLLALIPLLMVIGSDRDPAVGSSRLAGLTASPQFRWGLIGAFVVLQTVHFFALDPARETGPEWAPQIPAARQACEADPGLESVDIQHAPGTWATVIRCEDL
ncbi:hypothetical protein [Arthrobacter sp. zg-Y877]|uniref:hypothetical protein n=1 Tax=Arthrobacter sp. zg-Y877 TaxID=3049074 RepID=UPI0025A4C8CF|nr:hypothetical protein [Arthrobacter sp. zg-Y877]MDM7989795.1 hypothetical protein [Arthrobacter sp. zg-Y877]